MLSVIIAGILFQAFSGYYHFNLWHYFMSFFGDFLPFLSLFTVLSFFIHVLVNKKFVAYVLVMISFITIVALPLLGYDHNLYSFGGTNIGVYSHMIGYGHFLKPFLWLKSYWFVFFFILFVVASIFTHHNTMRIVCKKITYCSNNKSE